MANQFIYYAKNDSTKKLPAKDVSVDALSPDGIFDLIVEGDGNLASQLGGDSKVWLKYSGDVGLLQAGKINVYKKQMNTKTSDDSPLPSLSFTYQDFKDAETRGMVLLHDFSRSENPVSFKTNVTEAFIEVPNP